MDEEARVEARKKIDAMLRPNPSEVNLDCISPIEFEVKAQFAKVGGTVKLSTEVGDHDSAQG